MARRLAAPGPVTMHQDPNETPAEPEAPGDEAELPPLPEAVELGPDDGDAFALLRTEDAHGAAEADAPQDLLDPLGLLLPEVDEQDEAPGPFDGPLGEPSDDDLEERLDDDFGAELEDEFADEEFDDDEASAEELARLELALADLERALAEAVDGLEVLDRDLHLDGGVRIDLAGLDDDGALVLVALLGETPEEALLAALDLALVGQRDAALVARHLGTSPTGLRLVCVTEEPAPRLLERLALVSPGPDAPPLELFTLRRIHSARRDRTLLVEVPLGSRAARRGALTVDGFAVGLPAEQRAALELLAERLRRMDPRCRARYTPLRGTWSLGGTEFLVVERHDGRLEARVEPGGDQRSLDSTDAVEHLVEHAFGAYVALLGDLDEDEADRPASGARQALEAVTLTPEEIAAFQV